MSKKREKGKTGNEKKEMRLKKKMLNEKRQQRQKKTEKVLGKIGT